MKSEMRVVLFAAMLLCAVSCSRDKGGSEGLRATFCQSSVNERCESNVMFIGALPTVFEGVRVSVDGFLGKRGELYVLCHSQEALSIRRRTECLLLGTEVRDIDQTDVLSQGYSLAVRRLKEDEVVLVELSGVFHSLPSFEQETLRAAGVLDDFQLSMVRVEK
jgi:hypothetical protein